MKILKYNSFTESMARTGCEYFISSPCLLVHESKIDWLKENLNR